MLVKPELFLESVWDKLSDKEKKEMYLGDIIRSERAPQYLEGLIWDAKITLDMKITIAEKIIQGKKLTQQECTTIGFDNWYSN